MRQVGLGKNAEGFQRTVMKSPTKQNQSEDRDQYENDTSSLSSVSQMTVEMIGNKAGNGIKSVKRPL